MGSEEGGDTGRPRPKGRDPVGRDQPAEPARRQHAVSLDRK